MQTRDSLAETRYYTTQEVADMFGVVPQRIRQLLEAGRIDGAVKVGHAWVTPAGSVLVAGDRYRPGGLISEYIEHCAAHGVPPVIPPRWIEEEI